MIGFLISDAIRQIRRLTGAPADNRDRFRWELRFYWRIRPLYMRDSFMDGGTKFWMIGPFEIYRWIVHPE